MTKRVSEDRLDIIERASDIMEYKHGWNCRIVDDNTFKDYMEPLTWKVTWSSIGASSVEKTGDFMEQLSKMAYLAKTLNDMKITQVAISQDTEIKTAEDRDRCVERMMAAIETADYDTIRVFLEGGLD